MRKIKSKLCKRGRIKRLSQPPTDKSRVASIDAISAGVVSTERTQDAAPAPSPAADVAAIRAAVDDGRTALASLSSPNTIVAKAATAVEATPEAAESVYELWKPVLEKVEVFASLVESIGDPVIDQDKRDNAIANLLEAMDDLYGLVNKSDLLGGLDEYRQVLLKNMSKKTKECAEFIQKEAQFTNFWIRAGTNVISGSHVDNQVRDFTEAFVDLRRSFTEAGVLEAEIRVADLANRTPRSYRRLKASPTVCLMYPAQDSIRLKLVSRTGSTTPSPMPHEFSSSSAVPGPASLPSPIPLASTSRLNTGWAPSSASIVPFKQSVRQTACSEQLRAIWRTGIPPSVMRSRTSSVIRAI
ncbi:hypothetical protein BD311DRAFT_741791 [Dichomitus squalens]|uniref:Uncharacterized protein n=1 Tax=Dichomitus squalens TaxID=114155 RepID=A0A4Q9MEI4_9APHY|nr:hypothetical protein BD311DRAFT_741791 [Dichomitus squalens]